jgi:hypothetical protein
LTVRIADSAPMTPSVPDSKYQVAGDGRLDAPLAVSRLEGRPPTALPGHPASLSTIS